MGDYPRHAGAHTSEAGAENTYRAKRIILAIGRRADVNRLGIPGEDLPKVSYVLRDPAKHAGRKVCVIGGGDSAVEAAVACAEAGAEVTLSYRQDGFHRAKGGNQQKINALIAAGRLRAEFGTAAVGITPDTVELKRGDQRISVPNDDVMIFAGTKLPKAFLQRIGLRMAGEMTALRALWIASFAAFTYLFYVIKSGTSFDEGRGLHVAKKAFFPFGPDHPLGFVPDLLHVDLGFRSIDGSFWGTVCYSLAITGFGVLAYRKYPSPVQKKRYLSLIGFQLLFLFGIPELLAPLVIHGSPLAMELFGGERAWKLYTLTVPWPLNIWALIDAPNWTSNGSTAVAVGWLAAAAFVSFVLMPLYVWRNNEKFCSYLCGCGGLAETLGDFWRHLAPRGQTAIQAEWGGRIVFFAAIPVTLLILGDAWGMVGSGALYSVKDFAQHWYTLMVDFWLASVVGVALYPYLGNRVWCRFFCPLRAYMEMLSKRIGRLAIHANDKCIGCGECTRFCQMGIDVQRFAQKQQAFDNTNSACIQCGICVQVCPMEVLTLEAGRPAMLVA
jgi:NosR/NirI family nitrous oxide reductase transcriptional regulator